MHLLKEKNKTRVKNIFVAGNVKKICYRIISPSVWSSLTHLRTGLQSSANFLVYDFIVLTSVWWSSRVYSSPDASTHHISRSHLSSLFSGRSMQMKYHDERRCVGLCVQRLSWYFQYPATVPRFRFRTPATCSRPRHPRNRSSPLGHQGWSC